MMLVVQDAWAAKLRVAGVGIAGRTVARGPDGSLSVDIPEGQHAFALLESVDGRLRSSVVDCGVAGSDKVELRVAPWLVREVSLLLPREVTAAHSWVALDAGCDVGDLGRLSSGRCREQDGKWTAEVRLLAQFPTWVCLTVDAGDLWLELPSLPSEVRILPLVLPPLATLLVRDPAGKPVARALVECVMAPSASSAAGGTPMPFTLGRTDPLGRLCLPSTLVGARAANVFAPGFAPWSGSLTLAIELQPLPVRRVPLPAFEGTSTFFLRLFPDQLRGRLSAGSVSIDNGSLAPSEPGRLVAWSRSGQAARHAGSKWLDDEVFAVRLQEPRGMQGGCFAMGAPGWPSGLTVRSDGRTDFSNAATPDRLASAYVLGNSCWSPGTRSIPACSRGPVTYVRDGQGLRWHDGGSLSEAFDEAPSECLVLSLRVEDPTGLHLLCELVASDPDVFAVTRGFALWRRLSAAFVNAADIRVPVPREMRLRVRPWGHYFGIDAPEPLDASAKHELSLRSTRVALVYSATAVRLGVAVPDSETCRLPTLGASLILGVPPGEHEVRNEDGATRLRVDGPLGIVSMD